MAISSTYDIWANLKKITGAGAPGLDVGVDANNRILGFCYDAAGDSQVEFHFFGGQRIVRRDSAGKAF